MNPQLVIIAVGIIAPVCIVLFVRRAIISVPLGIIVVLVCYSGWPGWPEKDWFWVEQWLIPIQVLIWTIDCLAEAFI